jgi:hypothetical protein
MLLRHDRPLGLVIDPALQNPAGGASPAYRPEVCLRHPHWQFVCSQRQAFAWHPQAQEAQSQVPQQLAFAIFCEVDFLMSAMAGLL